MALKDILVCLDPTEAGERRLRLAAAIAREHHAHLSAAYILSQAIPGASTYEGVGIPAPAGANADWASFWASLTFEMKNPGVAK